VIEAVQEDGSPEDPEQGNPRYGWPAADRRGSLGEHDRRTRLAADEVHYHRRRDDFGLAARENHGGWRFRCGGVLLHRNRALAAGSDRLLSRDGRPQRGDRDGNRYHLAKRLYLKRSSTTHAQLPATT